MTTLSSASQGWVAARKREKAWRGNTYSLHAQPGLRMSLHHRSVPAAREAGKCSLALRPGRRGDEISHLHRLPCARGSCPEGSEEGSPPRPAEGPCSRLELLAGLCTFACEGVNFEGRRRAWPWGEGPLSLQRCREGGRGKLESGESTCELGMMNTH